MWEYAVIVKNSNEQIISYILSSSKIFVSKLGGVATLNREDEFSHVVIGVDEKHKDKMQTFLSKCITRAICSFFKSDYLDKHLNIKIADKIGLLAFKKALINFDKETDYYIVSKNLVFENNLYLESFYDFRLKKLRDKWGELIDLANENKEYLISSDAFMDLLKFLIDNIDIVEEEIDIVEDDDGYRIFSGNEENSFEGLSNEGLVSSVIEISPQKINLYCKKENSATQLLKQIYEQRVNLKFKAQNEMINIIKL